MSQPAVEVVRHDRIILAAQPDLAALDAWADAGATALVNSRTPEETASLPFDLKAEVEARGLTYLELPIGGAYGASPALAGQLAELLDSTEGDVVMHCKSGTRSAHLYGALLLSRDASIENVFDHIGWPAGRDPNMVAALMPGAGS